MNQKEVGEEIKSESYGSRMEYTYIREVDDAGKGLCLCAGYFMTDDMTLIIGIHS